MSEYNYLKNVTDNRDSIEDEVANEFDILNDEITKFTEGRGEIVYSLMFDDEKKIWFGDAAMDECFFIDFLSHLKNEDLENFELKNRLACISYNTTYPVLFHSPLAEMKFNSFIICKNTLELRERIKMIVQTQSFKNSLFRAKKGSLMQKESSVYKISFFQINQQTILFAAEYNETSHQWFGYFSIGSIDEEAQIYTDQADNLDELKNNLNEKLKQEKNIDLSSTPQIPSVAKIQPRLLFKLFNKSCENIEIARNCKIVQTKLDQIVPGGPTTIG